MRLPPRSLDIKDFVSIAKSYDLEIYSSNFEFCKISSVTSINETSDESLAFLIHPEQLQVSINECRGLVLVPPAYHNLEGVNTFNCKFLCVDDPKYFFAALLDSHYKSDFQEEISLINVHGTNIHSTAKISRHALVEEGATIGKNTIVSAGVNISSATSIGDNVVIGANSVLGGIGFGFAVRKGYPPMRIPHFGNLQIGHNVEIGSGTHIDRGTFLTTVISDDVKIDNGVHIAHNAIIGKRTLVIAHAEISGGVQIGEDCWIAPNVSIKEKVKIGNNVLVGIGSVVLKDIQSNQIVAGVPARPIGQRN